MKILPIGLVNGIEVTPDGIFVVVEVTKGSFAEWIEQEVAQGSINLEL